MNNKDFSNNSTYQKKPHALLVAEKPSVKEAIEEVYNKIQNRLDYDITFAAAAGHLIGLCEPNEYREDWGTPWKAEVLPMIPDVWKKKVINPKFYNPIKELWDNNSFDVIINAGDAGREGQLIQELIYESIGVNVPILRYWADDTTERGITKALLNMKSNDEYKGLTDAAYLRMYFDWLVGMNFSRSTSLSLDRSSSLGRVMTPTLAMIVKREEAIKNFKPTNYYELEGKFQKDKNPSFPALLLNPSEDKSLPTPYAFLSKEELEKILNSLGNEGTVKEIKKEEKVEKAPTLFNLSDLQKFMAKTYKYTPSETLAAAQSLYDHKYLSYPRTESKCITKEQARDMKMLISKLSLLSGCEKMVEKALESEEHFENVLKSTKYVDDKKVSDHPALTPTEELPELDELSEKERNVYMEVLKRLLAIFYPAFRTLKTSVTIAVGEYNFRSNGSTLIDIGWKKLYERDFKEVLLPNLNEGDVLSLINKNILSKETTPPSRYTFATILNAMETAGKELDDEELEKVLKECAGLGTAATRAEILQKLIKINYVYTRSTVLLPTDMGIELINALGDQDIVSPELTAKWEKKLKEVENGEVEFDKFYGFMVGYVKIKTAELLKLDKLGPYKKVLGKCPKCKRDFVSLGTFACCEGFLEKNENDEKLCDFALPFKFGGYKDKYGNVKNSTPLSETDIKNLISGLPTKPKKFTWKEDKKSETSLILTSDFKIGFPKPEAVGKCPKCGGDVMKSKKGYYCKNAVGDSPTCSFLLYPVIGKTELSEKIVKDVLEKGESEDKIKITWKSGKKSPFAAPIILEETENGYRFAPKRYEPEKVCDCPYCEGGIIYHMPSTYECSNQKEGKCAFRVYSTYGEANITPEDLSKMIGGGAVSKTVKFPDKKNKSKKKSFQTKLCIEKDPERGYIITFKK